MKNLIAKAKNGTEIKFNAWIENGFAKADYHLMSVDTSNGKALSIILFPAKFEEIFKMKCPAKKVNILLTKESSEIWSNLRDEAAALRESKVKTWAQTLEDDDELELWRDCASGGSVIVGLPETLKDKETILLKHLDFSWDITEERFILSITAKELLAAVKEAEKKSDENEKRYEIKMTALRNKAIETGQPVELSSWSEDCLDAGKDCDVDTVTEYINADGTITRVRSHSY